MVGTTTHRRADFFPDRINQFVKGMLYAGDVHDDGIYKLSFGAPAISDPNGIVAAFTITGGVTILPASFVGGIEPVVDSPWGRGLSLEGSAAGTPLVTVTGFDYLGQAMTENITLVSVTETFGVKAFARVTKIVVATGITGTIDVGFSDVLGLPYKTTAIIEEIADGAIQSAGTQVDPVLTDPATAVTGDPRGTYNPTVVLDGLIDVAFSGRADNWINAAGNGGYHGVKHFAA